MYNPVPHIFPYGVRYVEIIQIKVQDRNRDGEVEQEIERIVAQVMLRRVEQGAKESGALQDWGLCDCFHAGK